MNESQYGNQAVSMVVNLYLGILKGIPNLFHAFQDNKTMNFHRDMVEQDIVRTENAVMIAADDLSLEALRVKLQEKGICFIMAPSNHEVFGETVKANGRYLFFCREMDYERILEAVNEVKQERSEEELEMEPEEERERSREEWTGEETEEQEDSKKETIDQEESGYGTEHDGQKKDEDKEKKQKQKKRARIHKSSESAFHPQTDMGREAEIPDRKEPSGTEPDKKSEVSHDQDRIKETAYRRNPDFYQSADSGRKETPYRRENALPKNQANESKYRPASGHTAQKKGLAGADRNRVIDFHDRTGKAGESREETVQKSRLISSPMDRENPQKGREVLPQKRAPYMVSPSMKKENEHISPKTVVLGNSSALSEKTGTSKNQRSLDMTVLGGMSISAERMIRKHAATDRSKPGEIQSLHRFQGMYDKPHSSNRYTDPVNGSTTNQWKSTRAVKEYGSASAIQERFGLAKTTVSGKERFDRSRQPDTKDILAGRRNRLPPSAKIRIARVPMEYLPDQFHHQLGNETYLEGKKNLSTFHAAERLSYKTPGDILQTRRIYQTRDIVSPCNFQKLFRQGRRLVVQSVLPRESEGGKVAVDLYDRTSPIAVCMYEKFMAAGAIQIAQSTPCSRENLAAAFAAKNQISYIDAQEQLLQLFQNQLNGDDAVLEQLQEIYSLQGSEHFFSMLSGIRDEEYLNFLDMADISSGLKERLGGIPKKDLDSLLIGRLLKDFSSEKDQAFLRLMQAGYLKQTYRGASFEVLLRRYLRQSLKCIGQHSDAGLALEQITGGARYAYGAYKAGIRLLYTVAGKFHVSVQGTAAQFVADPVKALGQTAVRTAGKIARRTTTKLVGKEIIHGKTVRHASNALKFLSNPLKPITSRIMNTALMQSLKKTVAGKLTPILSKAGTALGWAGVIALIVILFLEMVQSNIKTEADSGSVNWNFAQDTEIIQEIITELTQKNEAFIADINDAASHRGAYVTTTGLTADENVSFYESGAYSVIFRDAYGNELEPTHVDLNNTKAIVSMASQFIPYPFRKLPESASEEEKKVYEELKQHFKDYCIFLWASTHQISIEEYHPGNSDGIEGAVDNSGLMTTLDKGICEKDGQTVWLPSGFTPDQAGGTICGTCIPAAGSGLGDYLDDLCTHGKDGNEHGGWRKSGNKRVGVNCRAAANGREHHDFCDHSESYCDSFTCDLGYYKKGCWHWEYEWVYECGGHMGLVVYVTIGDLSRLPGFPAAGDVDYESVGKYEADGSVEEPSLEESGEGNTE